MKLVLKRLHDGVALPRYETPGAAGMDLRADLTEEMVLPPGERALIPTGLAIELPDAGHAAFVFARSGLAVREMCIRDRRKTTKQNGDEQICFTGNRPTQRY